MNKTKTIHIVDAQPGHILAKHVFLEDSLIAPKNLSLTPNDIDRLVEFNIDEIVIIEQERITHESKEENEIQIKFKKEYKENTDIIKNVLNNLAVGKKLEISTMEPVFDSVYQQVSFNYSLIDYINEVRTADVYTYHHSLNVSLYAGLIAYWLELPEQIIKEIIQSGVLHDVGKARVPQEILFKEGALTPREFNEMKKHSLLGYRLVKNIEEISEGIRKGVLMHHEKADGKGYPLGLTNKKIHPYAKIIAVADVYDALTSERVYKKRFTPFDTFEEMQNLGYTHFDPKILITFLNNIASYYTGAKIKMNTGEIGEIMAILPQNISKPIIKMNGEIIDLSKEKNYKIEELI